MQQRADDLKWLADTAGRVVGLEGQVRGQTEEAMDYSLGKFAELDARLTATRAELEAKLPDMFAASEAKTLGKINPSAQAKTAANTLEVTGLKDRIDGLDQALKDFEKTYKAHLLVTEQHQAYLGAQFDAKPGEELTLLAHFKYLEDQIFKTNSSTLNPRAADEGKKPRGPARQEVR